MLKASKLLLPIGFLIIFSGCSEQTIQGEANYEETKKMVVDILKTDDGKKALQEVMADEKIKQQMVLDQAIVKDTIEQALTSDKGMEFWKKAFADPKFSESMAKSMSAQNETLLKNLMNNPEYRGKMIEVMKDPELQKEVTDTLKSKEYREHLQQIVTETFDDPLFQVKVQNLLVKAASEVKAGKSGGEGEDSGKEGGDSGGQS